MDRRSLLKLASLTASGAMLPARLLAAAQALSWQNWAGNQQAKPSAMHYPQNIEQIRSLLASSSGPIRCFGGSHSFSPLVPTDGILLSLEAMNGLLKHDSSKHTATFAAGTRLANASAAAWDAGLSFSNEPDVNVQSLAGAISTSTHGTGLTLPSLSAQIESLRLISADGKLHDLSTKDGDIFRAAICSLGSLGVISDITFQQQPQYHLRETTRVMGLPEALAVVEQEKDNVRGIELFAFPHGNTAIVKTFEEVTSAEEILPPDDSNELLEMVCEVTMRAGWLTPTIQRLLGKFIDEGFKQGPAWKVYGNVRTVRFNEMEYSVPAEEGISTLKHVCKTIRDKNINVMFPLEFRYVRADNSMIGMFSQRDSATISVHQYIKQDTAPLFSAIEPLLQKSGGRPHWGKMHTMNAEQLRQVYPEINQFNQIRATLDPQGRFLNSHLRDVFGLQRSGALT
jgi:FAD-linked oxidoreductase